MAGRRGVSEAEFVAQLRQLYRDSTQLYPTTPISQPPMEEQEQWDAARQTSVADLAVPNLTFVEPPDWPVTIGCAEGIAFRSDSQLRFFMDAAQDTRVLWTAGTIPVTVCSPVAVVLYRPSPGEELQLWDVRQAPRPFVLLPLAEQSAKLWQACEAAGLTPVNTIEWDKLLTRYSGVSQADVMDSYQTLRLCAYVRSLSIRRSYEQEILASWLRADQEGWLVADGTISPFNLTGEAQVIGLIKSHRREYFRGAGQVMLLGMPPLHRTNAFSVHHALIDESVPISWYLRWKAAPPPPTRSWPATGGMSVQIVHR